MKQIIRRVLDRRGKIAVLELPEPHLGPEQVLVQSHYTLISSGTELSTLAKTPLELGRQVLSDPWMRHVVHQTVFATGLTQTAQRIWHEMVVPREIGYSGAGRVLAVGEGVDGYEVGQKVAYAGVGHAELVAPTRTHLVAVPEDLDLRSAAFVTVGGIALHGLRRAEAAVGEIVVVYGLGLVGQICARLAKAAGCVVIGVDVDAGRVDLARRGGVDLALHAGTDDVVRRVADFSGKQGADATILCASSSSAEVVNTAMELTRRQGRVVIVGYVKLDIHPKTFLHREIDLRYSRAYGPGSYDRSYEKGRVDYPYGYVRWTEERNLAEVIRLLANGAVDLEPLVGGVFPLERAQDAFDAIAAGTLPGVAALLDHGGDRAPDRRRTLPVRPHRRPAGKVGIGVIGIGNHVLAKHLPTLRRLRDVDLRGLASATGRNATVVAERVGATVVTTDVAEVLGDPEVDGVLICSSQPEHYGHLRQAIAARKAVFVEKPLVTRLDHFREITRLMDADPVLLTLGLNRRYSPLLCRLRELLPGPVDAVEYVIAQPFVPPDHWTLDAVEGAGRLITEGEHFLDVCHLLVGRPPLRVTARPLGPRPDDVRTLCNFAITVHYEGAVANVLFDECGGAGFPRERLTVLAKGMVAVLDDFARLTVHGRRRRVFGRGVQKQMGHAEALTAFVDALLGRPSPMLTWEEARLATLSMFAAQESILRGESVDLRDFAAPAGE